MYLKKRISRLEVGIDAIEPGQSGVIVIYGLTEAEYQAGRERYERLHPLESNDGPGPDRIFIHFRRADPNLQDGRD